MEGANAGALLMSLWSHMKVIAMSWRDETERRKNLKGVRKRGQETEFLPEALEIVETPPSPFGRLVLWVIMLAFVLALIWSIWGRIDIVATAQGKVVLSGQTKTIEAPEAGLVRAIHVKNGDTVKAGDILFELDKTISSADSDAVKNEVLQAETRAQLAKGILDYLKTGRIHFERPKAISEAVAQVSERQLSSRIQAYREEMFLFEEEQRKAEAGRAAILQEIGKLNQTLPLLRQRQASFRQLVNEGLAPQLDALRLQEEVITRERDLRIAKSRLSELGANVAVTRRRLKLLKEQLRRDALDELAEAEAMKADRTEAEKKAQARNSWQTIRSPVDGTVLGLQVFTIGGVIEPGAPLALIAPIGDELIVEAMILNKDIGFVREGDKVSVKLEAYPFTRYGLVEGTLDIISADAMPDERVGLVFPARVTLKHAYVGEGELKRELTAGMNATAEIKTGDRRIIDFILSPIAKAGSEAARER